MDGLPFSQACENNRGPILEVLGRAFQHSHKVLEIASGTAQHATWFAGHLPHLHWQPTEMPAQVSLLRPRCENYTGGNLAAPLALDVSARPWPVEAIPDAVFTANSLHIMPWESVCELFAELGERAHRGTVLAIYGPFNYAGEYTSPSNARFDKWLANQAEYSAIRDFEKVDALAQQAGFTLLDDQPMPANNRLLQWQKTG